MVSKNNQWQKRQKEMQTVQHFGIRKLTVGVSSVLLGLSFMGMAATNVKADTVSGSQTTEVTAEQATDSAKKVNDPAPANDVQKGADQKSATPVASQTQTVQVNDLQKTATTVPADSLKESKAVSTEPEAKEVDLQIRRDSGDKTNDWYPSSGTVLYNGTHERFGIEGSFVIPKDEIKNGNRIKLLTINQTSDTSWKSNFCFEWLPGVYVHGKQIGTLWSDADWNGDHQPSSMTLYLDLINDVSSFNQTDLYINLNVSHAGVFGYRSDLLPLGKLPNHESTVTYTIMNGKQKGKSYEVKYALNQSARDMTTNEAKNLTVLVLFPWIVQERQIFGLIMGRLHLLLKSKKHFINRWDYNILLIQAISYQLLQSILRTVLRDYIWPMAEVFGHKEQEFLLLVQTVNYRIFS